jgi:transcriptional regulator with XRE-family HTH domain
VGLVLGDRTARALVDWTQSDLAKAAGIALATLKRFEKSYRVPTDRTMANICKVLKKGGVEFQYDGKRLGESMSVRKMPK